MRIKQKSSSKKLLILSTVSALLIVGAGIIYYYVHHGNSDTSTESSKQSDKPLTAEQNKAIDQTSQPKTSSSSNASNPQNIVNEPTTNDMSGALTITQLAQTGQTVKVTATLAGTSGGGRCIAYFTSSNKDAVSVYLDAIDSPLGCRGDIDAARFNFLGTWTVRIAYTTPDNKIVESSSKVDIR